MRQITATDLYYLAKPAVGEINTVFCHWSAGWYNNQYPDYHINIDDKGTIYLSEEDLTTYLPATWHRNTGSVAISMDCCVGAVANNGYDADLGENPPTEAQIEATAKVVDVLCAALGLPIDFDHVMTHQEVADIDDYGPKTTCERWDLWYLPNYQNNGKMVPGGDLIRGKAAWYKEHGYAD